MIEIGGKKPTLEQATKEEIIAAYQQLCAGDKSNNKAIEILIERFGEEAVIEVMPKIFK